MEIIYEKETIPKEYQSLVEGSIDLCRSGGAFLLSEDGLDVERCQISLSFVSKDEIKNLNSLYRGKDRATDVLSFPQFEVDEEVPEDGEILLGDVVICLDVCREQAEDYGHSFQRELVYLFIHSICHLLGYDHEGDEEKKVMREAEERALSHISVLR